ncbi:hypothetical protein L596_022632 [Steinernema carpocapsae]|uniref:Uncharacterized protein n=1 Tax=Steinernema carpocapsae TaxID=34508 RepID=A0A4U5MMD6_STECR|nr:hypothetical protein L596_022632 [Steinernema carpocapsae]
MNQLTTLSSPYWPSGLDTPDFSKAISSTPLPSLSRYSDRKDFLSPDYTSTSAESVEEKPTFNPFALIAKLPPGTDVDLFKSVPVVQEPQELRDTEAVEKPKEPEKPQETQFEESLAELSICETPTRPIPKERRSLLFKKLLETPQRISEAEEINPGYLADTEVEINRPRRRFQGRRSIRNVSKRSSYRLLKRRSIAPKQQKAQKPVKPSKIEEPEVFEVPKYFNATQKLPERPCSPSSLSTTCSRPSLPSRNTFVASFNPVMLPILPIKSLRRAHTFPGGKKPDQKSSTLKKTTSALYVINELGDITRSPTFNPYKDIFTLTPKLQRSVSQCLRPVSISPPKEMAPSPPGSIKELPEVKEKKTPMKKIRKFFTNILKKPKTDVEDNVAKKTQDMASIESTKYFSATSQPHGNQKKKIPVVFVRESLI